MDNFKKNYQLLSAFPDNNDGLAALAFGSLLPDGHLFSFLVLHLLLLVGPTKESCCGTNGGYIQLSLPIHTLPSPPCSDTRGLETQL